MNIGSWIERNQSQESGYNTGPYRAMPELLGSTDRYRVLSQDIGFPVMTLLWRAA